MTTLGMQVDTRLGYDAAIAKVTESLKAEGFGVLTEIDVKDTLKKKLDVDFRRYRILGACNPPFAHRALGANLDAGLLLPCNVVVYEGDDGLARVRVVDPLQTMATTEPALAAVAAEVREKLSRVVARLVEAS